MKRLLAILVCALALSAAGASARKQLVIVHVNDTHSHLDAERSGSNAGHGGVLERCAYLDSLRKAVGKNNVLLLHAGDWDQGSPYFTIFGGDLEVNLINAMRYDCLTLGNHEFDNGIESLASRVSRINAPVVCANYDFSSVKGADIPPYAIVKKAGLRIGIIGALPNIKSVVSAAVAAEIPPVEDASAEFNKYASYLKNTAKCDMVILLSHMGFDVDTRTAPELKDVDIIVGGHSHTVLKDLRYVDDADGKALPIIQDGCWGLTIGRIDVD